MLNKIPIPALKMGVRGNKCFSLNDSWILNVACLRHSLQWLCWKTPQPIFVSKIWPWMKRWAQQWFTRSSDVESILLKFIASTANPEFFNSIAIKPAIQQSTRLFSNTSRATAVFLNWCDCLWVSAYGVHWFCPQLGSLFPLILFILFWQICASLRTVF